MPAGQYRLSDVLRSQLQGCRMSERHYARLNSGYNIPLLGWGSSGAKEKDAVQAVKAAINAGFRVGPTESTKLHCLHVYVVRNATELDRPAPGLTSE